MTAEPDREARTTGQTTTRRSVILFLKTFLSLPASRSITAHTLIKLFLTSMKLMPVALAAQCFGMAAIDAVMRTKPEMFELLLVWSFFGFAQLIASLAFVRSLWRDARRGGGASVCGFDAGTILASCAGLLWGAAGAVSWCRSRACSVGGSSRNRRRDFCQLAGLFLLDAVAHGFYAFVAHPHDDFRGRAVRR